MSAFEFVFSLFGLLLGFSLVEVLGGLAKAIEAKVRPDKAGAEPVRIGWLTPLLGIFVMLDLVSFWGAAWIARDLVTAGPRIMLGGLVFAGSYYLAAHLVFPPDPRAERDLDQHYFRVRRIVFATVGVLFLLQLAYWLSVPELAAAFGKPAVIAKTATFAMFLTAAVAVRGYKANLVCLILLIASYLYDYVL
ncbi:hypothetical protein H8M03_06230 [Sphingomonas sabuli]|uniref:Uncharacterized protein n=1 Tax=Sphingomonas sabuli TaxID=2764186 RepID=A0A7G9L5K3_9SPHN|nr:hypothetical protein [Sphingomonas sabuli]QNM83902.1 hypothetical protein H8M03_06230 [Sphingomonas sabuli]